LRSTKRSAQKTTRWPRRSKQLRSCGRSLKSISRNRRRRSQKRAFQRRPQATARGGQGREGQGRASRDHRRSSAVSSGWQCWASDKKPVWRWARCDRNSECQGTSRRKSCRRGSLARRKRRANVSGFRGNGDGNRASRGRDLHQRGSLGRPRGGSAKTTTSATLGQCESGERLPGGQGRKSKQKPSPSRRRICGIAVTEGGFGIIKGPEASREVSHLAAHLLSEARDKSSQHSSLASFLAHSSRFGRRLQHSLSCADGV
jgi:hypothetical protein